MTPVKQLAANRDRSTRKHLTFRGNVKSGRHGWLRLTPAYSLHLVNEILEAVEPGELVLDPFSGTGTTPLAGAIHGVPCDAVDINPFLVWLGNLKLTRFDEETTDRFRAVAETISVSLKEKRNSPQLWVPDLFKIDRWWDADTLSALSQLFDAMINADASTEMIDLLKVAFCQTMIECSNASFGHQSMSFKKDKRKNSRQVRLFDDELVGAERVSSLFESASERVAGSLTTDQPRTDGRVFLGDSRRLDDSVPKGTTYSKVITSPPYPNRMSYIRELRPYMYWLGFLESGRQAGELDWQAIGGTWGCATSNLGSWQPENGPIAYPQFDQIVKSISKDHDILGRYVHRYFDDVKLHIQSLKQVLRPGAECFYIVGNSKFYGTMLPVEEIYSALFADAGFRDSHWEIVRKRNSKKELFEYVVYARNAG